MLDAMEMRYTSELKKELTHKLHDILLLNLNFRQLFLHILHHIHKLPIHWHLLCILTKRKMKIRLAIIIRKTDIERILMHIIFTFETNHLQLIRVSL